MNVLLIGNGGREHALAWKIAQSPQLKKLFVAPGNAGTSLEGENVALDVTDHAAVIAFSKKQNIDLVVVGPEAPLVAGLADDLRANDFLVFGPSRQAAQLEGSKAFTKTICDEMAIPTAGYGKFDALQPALDYVRKHGAPIVIKADGLAAGKGVTVAMSLGEAEAALNDCFSGSFGAAGAEVVIEEFLEGEEVSVFAICDGQNFVTLASAQDHKRAFDGDKGPNTGGMGAYSPASVLTQGMMADVEKTIIAPTVKCLHDRGTPFNGVLYAGLMLTANGPKLIEYNARFGDPECQVLMMRLQSDLLDLLAAAARGDVSEQRPVWDDATALTVVLAASGYPGSYAKGTVINGAGDLNTKNVQIFHAGTASDQNRLLANGGRVLNVTALGDGISEAQSRAYAAVDAIDWPEGFCRRDIGWREINRSSRGV